MNWDAIGAVGEILGGLGVLGSLIYLATQIRDNTRNLQAASLQSILDGPRDRFFLPLATSGETSDIFARGLNSLDHLDDAERRRFFLLMFEQFFQMQQVMELHERGLLPKPDYDAWLKFAASLVTTPGGTAIWPYAETTLTPSTVDVINDYLERNPDHPSYIELNPLFRYSAPRGDAA